MYADGERSVSRTSRRSGRSKRGGERSDDDDVSQVDTAVTKGRSSKHDRWVCCRRSARIAAYILLYLL